MKKEVKKLTEQTKKCSLFLAAHIDDNVMGSEQAQEEVTNLFDHAMEEKYISDEPPSRHFCKPFKWL